MWAREQRERAIKTRCPFRKSPWWCSSSGPVGSASPSFDGRVNLGVVRVEFGAQNLVLRLPLAEVVALSFPKKPMVVFIIGPSGERVTLIQGQGIHFASRNGVSGGSMTASWSGNTVRWYSQSSVQAQLNEDGKTYRVLALLQAG